MKFDAPDSSTNQPYSDGVVLIEDAAAASDPCFGCGLSLTLRDVRVLRDRLTSMPDFAAAADVYAASMAGSGFEVGAGAAADAWLRRALPKIAEDPSRVPDFVAVGREALSDEAARRRVFAEDWHHAAPLRIAMVPSDR